MVKQASRHCQSPSCSPLYFKTWIKSKSKKSAVIIMQRYSSKRCQIHGLSLKTCRFWIALIKNSNACNALHELVPRFTSFRAGNSRFKWICFQIYTRQLWDSGIQYFVKRSSLVSFCRRNHETRPSLPQALVYWQGTWVYSHWLSESNAIRLTLCLTVEFQVSAVQGIHDGPGRHSSRAWPRAGSP